MNTKALSSLFALITSLILPGLAVATGLTDKLVIENAWIAEAPPVSKVMVAYMTIRNTGSKPVEIVSATSGQYSSIEFHETVQRNGMASMIRHESLHIAAHAELELRRGGPHLMLFNPAKALVAGDTVNITFTTSDDTDRTVAVTVKSAK